MTQVTASHVLQIGNPTIAPLPQKPECIAIMQDGEGGHFSLQEFRDVIQQFVSERL